MDTVINRHHIRRPIRTKGAEYEVAGGVEVTTNNNFVGLPRSFLGLCSFSDQEFSLLGIYLVTRAREHLNFCFGGEADDFRVMLPGIVDDPRVVLIKLADRLHNMRTIHITHIVLAEHFFQDLNNFESDPKQFARSLFLDLGITDPEARPAIAVAIREQLSKVVIQNVTSARESRVGKKGHRGLEFVIARIHNWKREHIRQFFQEKVRAGAS
ncbi:hypothetical protein H6P81_013150 [Aristolochia fimbriata]|uniref:Uncharacterized protein n=1 Tax=Aristolochia fimbriata TaxID=158543 RepID=A0AAV7EDV5_ARIFI|nr:hypothetical protein H6P81_013150 [Aristolochia fimbriata]